MGTTPRSDWRDRLGHAAERYAAGRLRAAGLLVLRQRFSCRHGEIDLVARDGNTLVFVEVKLRSNNTFGAPVEAVGWHKQRRLIAAARRYLSEHGWPGCESRFDVIGITRTSRRLEMEWIKDAFCV